MRFTTFDGRRAMGTMWDVDDDVDDDDDRDPLIILVDMDGKWFSSWELGSFFGPGRPTPFKKIEKWEREQKKRPKSAMKAGKH